MEETTIRTKYVIEFLEGKKSELEQVIEYSEDRMKNSPIKEVRDMFEGMRQGYKFGLQLIEDTIFVINQCAKCQKRINDEVQA